MDLLDLMENCWKIEEVSQPFSEGECDQIYSTTMNIKMVDKLNDNRIFISFITVKILHFNLILSCNLNQLIKIN